MTSTSPLTEATLEQYLFGHKTWAEIAGLAADQARAIADFGTNCMQAGKVAEAVVVFDGLLAFNPRDAYSHSARAALYEHDGDDTRALAHYCVAVELAPRFALPRLARAELLLRHEQHTLARADLDATAALEVTPAEAARRAALASRLARAA